MVGYRLHADELICRACGECLLKGLCLSLSLSLSSANRTHSAPPRVFVCNRSNGGHTLRLLEAIRPLKTQTPALRDARQVAARTDRLIISSDTPEMLGRHHLPRAPSIVIENLKSDTLTQFFRGFEKPEVKLKETAKTCSVQIYKVF